MIPSSRTLISAISLGECRPMTVDLPFSSFPWPRRSCDATVFAPWQCRNPSTSLRPDDCEECSCAGGTAFDDANEVLASFHIFFCRVALAWCLCEASSSCDWAEVGNWRLPKTARKKNTWHAAPLAYLCIMHPSRRRPYPLHTPVIGPKTKTESIPSSN